MLQFTNVNKLYAMKIYYCFLLLVLSLSLFSSCEKEEGFGGSSALEGYVYKIEHSNDNFSFKADTFPALDQRVYLQYPSDLEDIRTDSAGRYRVNFLRSGDYAVYAHSELQDDSDNLQAEVVNVHVSGKLTVADTIFIHTGKANGTAMIRGKVMVSYYNKGDLVSINGESIFPAVETRVFIKYLGDQTYFDDVRVGDQGVFIFQEVKPGRDYEIYASTEVPGEEYKNILLPESQIISLPDVPYEIYDLEEAFMIKMNN